MEVVFFSDFTGPRFYQPSIGFHEMRGQAHVSDRKNVKLQKIEKHFWVPGDPGDERKTSPEKMFWGRKFLF